MLCVLSVSFPPTLQSRSGVCAAVKFVVTYRNGGGREGKDGSCLPRFGKSRFFRVLHPGVIDATRWAGERREEKTPPIKKLIVNVPLVRQIKVYRVNFSLQGTVNGRWEQRLEWRMRCDGETWRCDELKLAQCFFPLLHPLSLKLFSLSCVNREQQFYEGITHRMTRSECWTLHKSQQKTHYDFLL